MGELGASFKRLVASVSRTVVFALVWVPRQIFGAIGKVLPDLTKLAVPFAQYAALATVIILVVLLVTGRLGGGRRREKDRRRRNDETESSWESEVNQRSVVVDSDRNGGAAVDDAGPGRRPTLMERAWVSVGTRPETFETQERPREVAGGRCGGAHRLGSDGRTCVRPREQGQG